MIIAVDFDGTLCKERFPAIGEPKKEVIKWLKRRIDDGHQIVLWTCREGDSLKEAVDWCTKQGLSFEAINENVDYLKGHKWGKRKIIADIYLDDKAINVKNLSHVLFNCPKIDEDLLIKEKENI